MPATKPYKAAFAFIVTFVGAVLVFVQDKTEFSDLSALQWLTVLGFALVNTAGVYQIDNKPTGTRRNEVGQGYIGLAIGVLLVVILVIVLLRLA